MENGPENPKTGKENVIPFPGRRRPSPEKPEATTDELLAGNEGIRNTLSNMLTLHLDTQKAERDRLMPGLTLKHIVDMKNTIESTLSASGISAQETAKNIAIRKKMLQDHTPEKLAETAIKSTKIDWVRQPSFYLALIEKIEEFLESQRQKPPTP